MSSLRQPRCPAPCAAPHTSMFLRMLCARRRPAPGPRAAALLAMVVAAAVATAMLNLYVDVQAKLRSEFRKYGANVVVVARDGQILPDDALHVGPLGPGCGGIAVPFAYAVARTSDGRSVVVAGTDFEQVRKLNALVVGYRLAGGGPRCAGGRACASVVGAQGSRSTSAFRDAPFDSTRPACCTPAPPKTVGFMFPLTTLRVDPCAVFDDRDCGFRLAGRDERHLQRLTGPSRSRRPSRAPDHGGRSQVLGKTRSTLLVAPF